MKLHLHLHTKLGMAAIMTLVAGWAINAMAVPISAIGGDIVFDRLDGSTAYRFHVFTNAATTNLSFSTGGAVDVLIVGGGGGGGGDLTSSGGGGGVVFTNLTIADDTNVTVTVGAGGVGSATQNLGQPGANSVFGAETAYGGGGRGANNGDGASGSGSSGRSFNEGAAVDYTPYQGHDGGVRTGNYGGGGGGGAGGVGGGVGTAAAVGGVGGDGLDYTSFIGTTFGDDGWFGGGGGGCSYTDGTNSVGVGGTGGGGMGGSRDTPAEHGLPNSGGGGGGGGHDTATNRRGGDGGSGIVIVRYEIESPSYLISEDAMVLANPINANTQYTSTNEVNVVGFPIPEDYTHYQVTESGEASAIDSGSWIATNVAPTKTFTLPAADTNITLYAWFTNAATESAWVWRIEDDIAYATDPPDVSVHATLSRALPPVGPTPVVLPFGDVDNGTTGGEYDGEQMTFDYGLYCHDDVTPAESYVTLDSAGDYDVILTVTNAAGSVGVATSVVSVTVRSEYNLYVSPDGDNSTGIDWQSAYQHPTNALVYAVPGDTILLSGDTFVLDAQLDLNLTNLTLSGGYAATNEIGIPGEYDTRRWRTVLTRDPEAGRVRLIEISANDVTVERLELRDGSADGPGGGIHAANVNGLKIRHCRFINNVCYATWGTEGGGLSLVNVQGSVNHSLFKGNSSTRWHGTYGATAGNVAIKNGLISMFDIVLVGDHGSTHPHTGSGIWISGGQHGLTNILAVFLGRQNADQGSGIHLVAGSQVEIANATLYGNYGDGIRNLAGDNTVIRDSIIYGNTHPLSGGKRDIINGTDGSGTPAILYNNIIGDGGGVGGNGNLDVDPRFVYPLFYLASDSPALDSGSRTVVAAGLTNWTSRIDGATYAGTVNRGYHFTEGLGIDLELYVSPDGNDANDGSGHGPTDALRTITRALAIAGEHERLEPRVRIHVAAGDYTTGAGEVFPLAAQGLTVQIMGTNAAATVIDAGGSATGNQRVFTLTDSLGDNRIEGVTLTGGYISGITARGIGVYADKSLLTVASSILRDNIHVGTQYGIGYGAGLYAVESGVIIRDSEIRDNRVSGSDFPRGGGVSVERGRTILENVIMSGNESRNTHATWGGSRAGGLNVFGAVVLRNTLMTGNKATVRGRTGNAIYMQGGDLIIENATIVTNINDISSGVAIHRAAGTVTLRNTILWDNVGDFNATNAINIAHSLSTELDDGVNNNLTSDPLFADADAGDFRLTALASGVTPSPGIDAGTNLWWMAGAVDLDGQPRILRGIPSNPSPTVDMGAYETAPPSGSMFMFR